jgi:hypothetical protein
LDEENVHIDISNGTIKIRETVNGSLWVTIYNENNKPRYISFTTV